MNIPSRVNPFGYDNSLPPGYFRVDFLENELGAYIDTEVLNVYSYELDYEKVGGQFTEYVIGYQVKGTNLIYGCPSDNNVSITEMTGGKYARRSSVSAYDRHTLKHAQNMGATCYIDGVAYSTSAYGAHSAGTSVTDEELSLYLFGAHNSEGLYNNIMQARIYSCKLWDVDENLLAHLIPVMDATGTQCVFDLVTTKTFYKENNSAAAFSVGLTMEQALNLAKLPATEGRLTVSLPLEAAFDANVQSALNTATDKGWTIIVQYRESEVATANLAADFLESDGVASMELPFESKNKSFVCEHTMGMPKATSGLFAYGGTAVSSGYAIVYRAANQGFMFAGNDWIASGKFLRGEKYKILWKVTRNEAGKFIFGLYHDGKVLKELTQSYNQYWRNIYYVFGSTNYNTRIGGAAYELTISIEGKLTCHGVPAIDLTGAPCLYDTVSRQNFYNADTTGSAFIVGFDTIKKAAVSLSKLPVTTDGTLTVSLPSEAEEDTWVDGAIDIATKRGWTIITQYR